MKNVYEAIMILKNNKGEGATNALKCRKYFDGIKAKFEDVGDKKLAYSMKRHTHGYCFMCDFICDETFVTDIKSSIEKDDNIIKFIVIKLVGEDEMDFSRRENEIDNYVLTLANSANLTKQ